MKKLSILVLVLTGCIQTDLEDPFQPTLRFDNELLATDFRVNGSYPLVAVYTDDTGEPAEVPFLWESSDESILSFNENTASIHAEGLVLITVSANGLDVTQAIQTLPSRGSLQITGFTPRLQIGKSAPFKFNFIDLQGVTNNDIAPTWSSSNPDIATVTSEGVVEAMSPGTSDIVLNFDGVSNAVRLEVSTDPVMLDPVLRMVEFVEFISVGESFPFLADYYTESGEVDPSAAISWSTSNESVLSISEEGIVTAESAGIATIEASFQSLTIAMNVEVEGGEVTERSGMLMGTGYDIEGDFTLHRNEDGDLILTIEGYRPDGPGPYFYLTNQNNNVNNGLSLGEADVAGDVVINVSDIDSTVRLSTFNYLMIWCEPFRVRLGVGEFEN